MVTLAWITLLGLLAVGLQLERPRSLGGQLEGVPSMCQAERLRQHRPARNLADRQPLADMVLDTVREGHERLPVDTLVHLPGARADLTLVAEVRHCDDLVAHSAQV